MDLQRSISVQKNHSLIGTTIEVLVEGDSKKSHEQWMGHTEWNTTVVWDKSTSPSQPGDLVSLAIEDASASTLFGRPASLSS